MFGPSVCEWRCTGRCVEVRIERASVRAVPFTSIMAELALHVIPGLYIGPFLNARSRGWLRRHGITHVVNATPQAPCPHEELTYLRMPIEDNPCVKIEDHFESCNQFIANALADGGTVLVHCHMGKSRSATLIAAYLIAERSLNLDAALELVRQARPGIAPNSGFMRGLRQYEKRLASASRCSCHELRHQGHGHIRCVLCEEEAPSLPGVAAATASNGAADGEAGGSGQECARFEAFVELLRCEPDLEELAFVPGPLHAGLFADGDASDGVRVVPLPPLEAGLICAAHKAALDIATLAPLLRECQLQWADSPKLARWPSV